VRIGCNHTISERTSLFTATCNQQRVSSIWNQVSRKKESYWYDDKKDIAVKTEDMEI